MAEVIGIIASTAQLISYCSEIWSLLQDIKGGISSLQAYQKEIEELKTLSEAIINNTVFHTLNIGSLIESINDIVAVIDLKPLLQKSRINQIWGFLSKKENLFDRFEAIERKKTILSLHMHLIQAELLSEIKTDLTTMSEPGKRLQKKPTDKKTRSSILPLSTRSNSSLVASTELGPKVAPNNQLAGTRRTTASSSTTSQDSDGTASLNLDANSQRQDSTKYQAVFNRNVHTGNGDMVNGLDIEGPPPNKMPDMARMLWFCNTVAGTGKGSMVNGLQCLDIPDMSRDFSYINITGDFIGNKHNGEGKMVNGMRVKNGVTWKKQQ